MVQDLVLCPHVVRYRRQRWLTPDGRMVVAPLPAGLCGHFGPEVQRFVLAQYHRGQVTVRRLVGLLRDIGVDISERQVARLLNGRQQGFMAEARHVLRAGVKTARWITVDDTGARHKAANGACTQIGDHRFAWLATTVSKSRLNFHSLLRAGPHQRLGERHPLPGDQAQGLGRHAESCGPRRPRRVPRPDEDLRQARRLVLGLPRHSPHGRRRPYHSAVAEHRPSARQPSLSARTFAPVTENRPGSPHRFRAF